MRTELELTGGFNNMEVTADFDKSNLIVIDEARASHNGWRSLRESKYKLLFKIFLPRRIIKL